MALEFKDLVALGKVAAKSTIANPVAYNFNGENLSYDAVQATFRKELNELAPDYYAFEQNKVKIFQLLGEIYDDVLPKKIDEVYGQFAEFRQFAQGDKPVFKRRLGKRRAKNFVTKVGLAGVYEVFKLASSTFEISMTAYGGAAEIGIEEFLDGRVDFNELIDIVNEGMGDAIYKEIAKALEAAVGTVTAETVDTATGKFKAINTVVTNKYDEAAFDKLIANVSAYGTPVIYCTYEFATTVHPEALSETMKDELWANGYFARYKGGVPMIILPQSFVDETNAMKVMDPRFAYIMPSNGRKPVMIASEGQTLVREAENHDWSREIQTYKKLGVAVDITSDMALYVNTALKKSNV